MKIELDGMKIFFIVVIVLALGGGGLFNILNPKVETKTITVVKKDSTAILELRKVKADLAYAETQLKSKPKIVYRTTKVTDTLVAETRVNNNSVQPFTASIDSTFRNGDSLKASYKYPENEFNIWFKYHMRNIETTKLISQTKFIEFTHGIQAGVFYDPFDRQIHLGIGYGFQLRMDFNAIF